MHNFEKVFLFISTKSSGLCDDFHKNGGIFGNCIYFVTIVKMSRF